MNKLTIPPMGDFSKSLLPEKDKNEPYWSGTTNTVLDKLSQLEKAELRREIIQMIQKLSRLSKLIDVQGDVLKEVTNDWLEILGSSLLAKDVRPAYVQAMRTRTSTFPLQPFELINAHRQLSSTSSTYVTNGICPYCRNKGTVMVFDPLLKVDVEQQCIGAMHRLGDIDDH